MELLGAQLVGARELGVDAQLGLRRLQLRGQVGRELEAQLQAIAHHPMQVACEKAAGAGNDQEEY